MDLSKPKPGEEVIQSNLEVEQAKIIKKMTGKIMDLFMAPSNPAYGSIRPKVQTKLEQTVALVYEAIVDASGRTVRQRKEKTDAGPEETP